VIVASGLFPLPPGAGDSSASGQTSAPIAPPLEVAKKVALIGTVFGQQGGIMAILEDLPTKKQSLYRMGEEIPAVGALSAIEKNRVLFRVGTQEEWLDLVLTQLPHPLLSGVPASATVPHPSAPQRRILDRREIDAALADTTRLLTQAHAVPYLTDGKLDGFRLYSVMPLGFFDKIGLQTNDLLQRINGVEIRDPGMLLSLFQQLRNERNVRVDIVRNTQRQTLVYEIR
jgi:general secretion pathway protein C